MYRYGEDFNEARELDVLLEQFLQKKRNEDELISKEAVDANGAAEKT